MDTLSRPPCTSRQLPGLEIAHQANQRVSSEKVSGTFFLPGLSSASAEKTPACPKQLVEAFRHRPLVTPPRGAAVEPSESSEATSRLRARPFS